MVYIPNPMKQQSLFKAKVRLTHGGTHNRGKRKEARPLARKRPLHLVLKSRSNLYGNCNIIRNEINRFGKMFALRIYDIAVEHDHVHFLALIPNRQGYIAFIRALTGVLARKLGKKLWRLPPFTRIATWGRAYRTLKKYHQQNRDEAAGICPYTPRKHRKNPIARAGPG